VESIDDTVRIVESINDGIGTFDILDSLDVMLEAITGLAFRIIAKTMTEPTRIATRVVNLNIINRRGSMYVSVPFVSDVVWL
jgi:hypothetical protein